MKYIVLNKVELLMFPPHIGHADYLQRVAGPDHVCTGAGFVSSNWECYGESVGLGIGRGPTDDMLLQIAIRR